MDSIGRIPHGGLLYMVYTRIGICEAGLQNHLQASMVLEQAEVDLKIGQKRSRECALPICMHGKSRDSINITPQIRRHFSVLLPRYVRHAARTFGTNKGMPSLFYRPLR